MVKQFKLTEDVKYILSEVYDCQEKMDKWNGASWSHKSLDIMYKLRQLTTMSNTLRNVCKNNHVVIYYY
jgi:hypothetical protein